MNKQFNSIGHEKIPPTSGVGIEFEHNNQKCITIPRSEYDLTVGVEITTYKYSSVFSEGHFYASLNMCGLRCTYINDPKQKFSTNQQPEESKGKRIDVTMIAQENIYGSVFGYKRLEAQKGEPTSRFNNIKDCIEAIESTFNQIFGPPWKLVENHTDNPWEEYKKELVKDYQ